MDADDFRDYILGFIFYKYLSEKMHTYADAILRPDKLKYEDLKFAAFPLHKVFPKTDMG